MTYPDKDYEDAHQNTFSTPKVPIWSVLPPNVTEATLAQAIVDFSDAIGEANVFVGDGLSHYVDPYDLSEGDKTKRKLPSAAVWYVLDFVANFTFGGLYGR